MRTPRTLLRSNIDVLAALLLTASLLASAPALAEPTAATGDGEGFEGWFETAGMQLAVGDSVDLGGRLFDAPNYQHTLVVPNGGELAYLLALKAQTVCQLNKETLRWDKHDLPLPEGDLGEEIGIFTTDEGVIVFDSDLHTFEVRPEPPLVGEISFEKMQSVKADYFLAAEKYNPDPDAVAAVAAVKEETRILVFFGTWCSYCKRALPPLLKTLELAENPLITIEFFAVSEDQSEPSGPLSNWDVGPTPTIVAVQGEEELGRIEEEALVSIEVDLVHILGGE